MKDPRDSKEELTELSLETVDATIQLLTDSEIFDQIPIISSLYKIGKVIYSVPNILFIRKIQRFVLAVNRRTNLEERREFADRIKSSKRDSENLYEYILLKLESFDDTTKPEIFAKIFSCYLKGKIREEDYDSLAHALTSSSLANLRNLSKEFWVNGSGLGIISLQFKQNYSSLISSGLIDFDLTPTKNHSFPNFPATVARFPSSIVSEDEPPFNLTLKFTDLGRLFSYVVEDFEDYFALDLSIKNRFPYTFQGIHESSALKSLVKQKWL